MGGDSWRRVSPGVFQCWSQPGRCGSRETYPDQPRSSPAPGLADSVGPGHVCFSNALRGIWMGIQGGNLEPSPRGKGSRRPASAPISFGHHVPGPSPRPSSPPRGRGNIAKQPVAGVSITPLPECHLCRCPGLSFGKSLDSSELKCPVLQKGGLITSVLMDGVGIRCQSE